MKVFVTGSTGLVGNNLVRALVAAGYEVTGLVRSEEKARRLLGSLPIKIVKGDMRDVAKFADAIDGSEVVFHTAAYFREYYKRGDHAAALEEINIKGTLALIETSDRRGARRFVHVSSGGTVGTKPDGSPGDENTPPSEDQLENLYFRSKWDGDARILGWRGRMEVLEILPGWIWGPGDAAPTGAGQLAIDFLARKVPGILDGGTCVVDARDVATAMVAATTKGRRGERYIVGGEFHTLEEIMRGLASASGVPAPRFRLPHAVVIGVAWLMETIGELTGRDVLITRQAVRLMHAKHRISSEKAKRELGVSFRPLQETLRDVVAWYRENPISAAQLTPAHAPA